MFQLDLKSRKSIYEQVTDNLRELILSGVLKPDEKLPSVRELSKSLTVNPNTVQKAYRELERRAYVYTVSGLGTFVEKPESRRPDEIGRAEAVDLLRRALRELRHAGLNEAEIGALAANILSGKESDGI